MRRTIGLIGLLLLLASPLAAQKADTVTTTKRDSVPVYNVTQTITRTITKTVTVHDTVKVPTPPVVTPPPVDSSPPVVTPPGNGSYPNRPASYTKVLGEMDFSQAVPPGSAYERYLTGQTIWSVVSDADASGSNWSVVSDPTAPRSPASVWQLRMKKGTYGGGVPGVGGGTGFGQIGRPINSSAVYASFWIKWSAGFRFHDVSQKMVRMDMSGAGQAFLLQTKHDGAYFRASDEQAGIAYEPQDGSAPSTGVWHQVELLVVRGNPGTVKVWVDGKPRISYTNLPVAGTGNFMTFSIDSYMGGGGMVLPADQSFTLDHLFVAGP